MKMHKILILLGTTKFFLFPSPSFHKLSNLDRYHALYYRMYTQRQNKIAQELKIYEQLQNQKKERENIKEKVKEMAEKLREKVSGMRKIGNQFGEEMGKIDRQKLQSMGVKQNLQRGVKKGFQYMALFYQSLQNLVQGKRQVIHNQKFKFQDGETVKQKQQKFESLVKKLFPKS